MKLFVTSQAPILQLPAHRSCLGWWLVRMFPTAHDEVMAQQHRISPWANPSGMTEPQGSPESTDQSPGVYEAGTCCIPNSPVPAVG